MRSVILRSLAVIGIGGVILAGVLYVASTVDGRAPGVLEVHLTQSLPDDDHMALVTTSVEIVFSEPIDPTSAEAAVTISPEVATAASWSGATLTITPVEPLALDTSYVLTIESGLRDRAGNRMTELPPPFEFATVGRPELSVASPADGAVDVPVDAPLTLTFSTLMDTASVEAALRIDPAIEHELRWSGQLLTISPLEPLAAGTDYRIDIGTGATDIAGVHLAQPATVAFRTVNAGLEAVSLVPGSDVDGVATTTPIAVVFDALINPSSVSGDILSLEPDVAGTLEVVALPGDPLDADGAGRALVFRPSAPLPPNTTFTVEVLPGIQGPDRGLLAEPLTWSFTTGVAAGSVSNQVTFISDRSGIANLWAMNPDGSGQRQVSAELLPIVAYAIAPDGDSIVVSDGQRLIYLRADGSDRRILTDADALEFDPSFSPDGRRVVFARADALTGAGLGLWEWQVGGGEAEPVELPDGAEASPGPSANGAPAGALLRAPRYSPDGGAIAFVDSAGRIGILDLAEGELRMVPLEGAGAPQWVSDSALVVAGSQGAEAVDSVSAPVTSIEPDPDAAIYLLPRAAGSEISERIGPGSRLLAVGPGGQVAYLAGEDLWIADANGTGRGRRLLTDVEIVDAGFGPGGGGLVIARGNAGLHPVELVNLESGERSRLVTDGRQPRWQP